MEMYSLAKALMVYKTGNGNHYFQIHDVFYEGEEPRLREGGPLTKEALQLLCKEMVPSLMGDVTYLDGRVLATSGNSYGPDVWWVPPKIRSMFFSRSIKTRNGSAPWPGLVMAAYKGVLSIYSVTGGKRPGLGTKLYVAPLFNMTDSAICLGNAEVPKKNNDYDVWERAVFDSAFSEERNEARIKGKKKLSAFWRELIKNKAKEFPEEALLSCESVKTLGELIESLKKRGNSGH